MFQTSSTPPAAVPSQQGPPNSVSTGGPSAPNAVPSTGPGNPVTGANPGTNANSDTNSTSGGTTAVAGTSSNNLPLYIAIAVVVLLVLALAYLLLSRRQRAATIEAVAVGPATGPRSVAVPTAGNTAASASPRTPAVAPVAPVVAAAAAPVASGTSVTCPNCGTLNGPHENFCHECGQDLRPLHAAALAANEPVDEYTPYLETLSRVDEQLEYVLARPRVTIGSAANNDIVIDGSFVGNATVAPVQAELRREDGRFTVVNRGVADSTLVNGVVAREQALQDGDQIKLGDVSFVYHAPARPQ